MENKIIDKYEKYRKNAQEYNCEDDKCDLNPDKICDSCGKCIENNQNYKIIKITEIIDE